MFFTAEEECLSCGLLVRVGDLPLHLETCNTLGTQPRERSSSPSSSPRSVGSDFPPYRPFPAPAQLDGTLGARVIPCLPTTTPLVVGTTTPPSPPSPPLLARGYEDDYIFVPSRTPSPVGPAFSPITPRSSPLIKEHETLSDVLKAMEKTILPTSKEGNILPLDIRRDFVLVDALREGRKAKFAANKYLRVTFVGEGAVDAGGPRREFFRLLVSSAADSAYFSKGIHGSFFLCNSTGYQSNAYHTLGQYAAMSMSQGGVGFPFLHPSVYMYLVADIWSPTSVPLDSIPYELIKHALKKIEQVDSDDALRALLQEVMELLTEAGCSRPLHLLTLSDRKAVVTSLSDFHLFMKVKACMDQFKMGLELCGGLKYIKKYPDLLRPMLVDEHPDLTVDQLKDLLHPTFSESQQ